ncbi:MAG TPA: hypothetical protein VN644_14705 [Pyrinomonadaceae bacterium]|nr:hypothetical protein [Pyrinomonadaceae bacterium]
MKRVPLAISIILLLCACANAQSEVDLGTTQDGTYTNSGFGFSFKYPKDWVVHGQATNERIRELGKEKIAESGAASKANIDVALNNTYQLLTVFRQPLGTPGITFNPAIMVIAEKVAHAPGIKNGKDYLLNMRPLLTKAGPQVLLNEPVECQFGGSQFFRDDYLLEVNGARVFQAYFARLVNGYALVFAFMGQDQKSVDEMAKAMETFALIPIRKG